MRSRPRSDSPPPTSIALDASGFAVGVGLALLLDWRPADLVWSLWLSSLVIGYTTLLTGILRAKADAPRSVLHLLAGKLFLIAFFSVHFGGFHFVHSVFLNHLFPLAGGDRDFFPGLAGYGEVFRRYWPWLAAAAVAERQAIWPRREPGEEAGVGKNLMQPYANVVRMHLLIFFFIGASFAGLDGMLVYLVVYAAYFWPWRRAARATAAAAPLAAGQRRH